jgi:hypothetical protein
MPRWASRINLEIVCIRVERLNEISHHDALQEGLIEWSDPPRVTTLHYGLNRADCWETSAPAAYKRLWSTIHAADGPNGWAANPWVWVVEFKVVWNVGWAAEFRSAAHGEFCGKHWWNAAKVVSLLLLGGIMAERNEGGPAFPVVETHPVHGSRIDFGMTLRDYFAGQALAGLQFMDTERTYDTDAHNCYQMADAMIKARGIVVVEK